MAQGTLASPDVGRNKVATAPNSYRERTTDGEHKSRSFSMAGGLGEFPAVGVPPSFKTPGFNHISPLRSLYSNCPPCRVVDAMAPAAANPKANPGPPHALAYVFVMNPRAACICVMSLDIS